MGRGQSSWPASNDHNEWLCCELLPHPLPFCDYSAPETRGHWHNFRVYRPQPSEPVSRSLTLGSDVSPPVRPKS
jgi:hypothetical protein